MMSRIDASAPVPLTLLGRTLVPQRISSIAAPWAATSPSGIKSFAMSFSMGFRTDDQTAAHFAHDATGQRHLSADEGCQIFPDIFVFFFGGKSQLVNRAGSPRADGPLDRGMVDGPSGDMVARGQRQLTVPRRPGSRAVSAAGQDRVRACVAG